MDALDSRLDLSTASSSAARGSPDGPRGRGAVGRV